jgi:hypothetical protein
MPNRLASETSPYLLQHADNPVDWYPWGPEALERARRDNKPILLSIGYAACHWCHVMAHESFEDVATAALMNEHFVNIKVDREERPDIDGIYMQAVQAMTGHGGWPMTMFLTPDGVPFYGGTYFPKDDRHGMPSFRKVLGAVSDAYRNRPETVERTAASVKEMYANTSQSTRAGGALDAAILDNAYEALAAQYDERNGGFSGAPKFPQTMSLDFLLRYWARRGVEHALAMVRGSFLRMAHGGIYDQIGGGFARYSVDEAWLVPHFEKMLYDNALLVRLGAHLWQATHDDEVARIVDETIAWAVREMRVPEGGFVSSYDADSEGHEGRFYVWDTEELDRVLGADSAVMRAYWGATEGGNFEGANILSVAADTRAIARRFGLSEAALAETVARAKRMLYEARRRRVWPGRDDKVLASWNGLTVRAIAEAARAFDRGDYRRIAVDSAEFLFTRLVDGSRVLRSYKDGRARITGYLEDHAALALAAIAVYEVTFDERWLTRARGLADALTRWFWDEESAAFFDTASDHERLITRPREVTDNAIPSGTSLAVELLLRMAELYDDSDARTRATRVLESLAPAMMRYPTAFGHLLGCADMLVNGAVEVAIAGDIASADFHALVRTVGEEYVPSLVLTGGASTNVALLRDRPMRGGRSTAFVCRNYTCDEPADEPERLREQLERARTAGSSLRSG